MLDGNWGVYDRPDEWVSLMGGLSCLTQAQWLSGLSPHSSPEEPALPWVSVKSPSCAEVWGTVPLAWRAGSLVI